MSSSRNSNIMLSKNLYRCDPDSASSHAWFSFNFSRKQTKFTKYLLLTPLREHNCQACCCWNFETLTISPKCLLGWIDGKWEVKISTWKKKKSTHFDLYDKNMKRRRIKYSLFNSDQQLWPKLFFIFFHSLTIHMLNLASRPPVSSVEAIINTHKPSFNNNYPSQASVTKHTNSDILLANTLKCASYSWQLRKHKESP